MRKAKPGSNRWCSPCPRRPSGAGSPRHNPAYRRSARRHLSVAPVGKESPLSNKTSNKGESSLGPLYSKTKSTFTANSVTITAAVIALALGHHNYQLRDPNCQLANGGIEWVVCCFQANLMAARVLLHPSRTVRMSWPNDETRTGPSRVFGLPICSRFRGLRPFLNRSRGYSASISGGADALSSGKLG